MTFHRFTGVVLGMGLMAGLLAAPVAARAQNSPILGQFSFDPARFDADTVWLAPLLRLIQASGVVPLDEQPVADAILVASMLGSHPHRVTLYDLKASRLIPGVLDLDRLQLAISIYPRSDGGDQTSQLRATLETILPHYQLPGEVTQQVVDLDDDRQAVQFRSSQWPAWLVLEWTVVEGAFHLGVGRGALARHLATTESSPALREHRASLEPARVPQPICFELFADLHALKQAAPTLFQTGRTQPMLDVLGVGACESVMLHGRWSQTFLVLDLTTRLPGGTVSRNALTQDHWPAHLGVPEPQGRFHLVAAVDFPRLTGQLLALARLVELPRDRAKFDRNVQQFQQELGVDLSAFADQFEPYLLAGDFPRPWLSMPGAVTWYAVMRPRVDAGQVQQTFDRMMRQLGSDTRQPNDDVRVTSLAEQQVYWLDSPLRDLLKAPAWGWDMPGSGRVLVVSYSPKAVLSNRAWLTVNQP